MRIEESDPLPGAVCEQWKKCGKATCKCTGGELHGPYFYRFWRVNGRLVKRYVKREDVETVKARCQANRDFQEQLRASRRQASLIFALLRQGGF